MIIMLRSRYSPMGFDYFRMIGSVEAIIILILIAIQILFILNLIIGFTKGKKEQAS